MSAGLQCRGTMTRAQSTVPASPLAALQRPQRAVVRAMRTLRVMLADVVHAELPAAPGRAVAARVDEVARNGFQRHVAGVQQRSLAARALVGAGPAARADVVSGLAQRDGRTHVLTAQRTREHLEHALGDRRLGPRVTHSEEKQRTA